MPPIHFQPKYLESFDGTKLAVYEYGPREAPLFFFLNGLGGSIDTWKFVVHYFKDRYRFAGYDYRGVFNSFAPANRDFSMNAHVGDALVVLNHFVDKEAVVLGWSMGVQVALELAVAAPDKVKALVLANGAFGRPLDRTMPKLKPFVGKFLSLLAVASPALRPLAGPLLATPILLKLAKSAGLVSKNLDEEVFLSLARQFIELDFYNYRDCMVSLVNHDAEDLLEHIHVPTLVLGGGRDFLTPLSFSQEMAQRIRCAELRIIKDGSHYCAVEYPDELNACIDAFLRKWVQ